MAEPYSSGVLTLSSARGFGWSSSCASELIRNLRGQFLPVATCAAIAARLAGSQIAHSGSGRPSWLERIRSRTVAAGSRAATGARRVPRPGTAGRRRAPATRHRDSAPARRRCRRWARVLAACRRSAGTARAPDRRLVRPHRDERLRRRSGSMQRHRPLELRAGRDSCSVALSRCMRVLRPPASTSP